MGGALVLLLFAAPAEAPAALYYPIQFGGLYLVLTTG